MPHHQLYLPCGKQILNIAHLRLINHISLTEYKFGFSEESTHYLYFPMTGASVDTIEDIGEVIDDSLLEDSPSNELVKYLCS